MRQRGRDSIRGSECELHVTSPDGDAQKTTKRRGQSPPNLRMHLTGYSGLRPLPPAGDAGR